MPIKFKLKENIESDGEFNPQMNQSKDQNYSESELYSVRKLGKLLGLGQTKMFRMLRGEGILDESNCPTDEFIHDFELVETNLEKKPWKEIQIPRLTEKGFNRLAGLLKGKVDTYKKPQKRIPKQDMPNPTLYF